MRGYERISRGKQLENKKDEDKKNEGNGMIYLILNINYRNSFFNIQIHCFQLTKYYENK